MTFWVGEHEGPGHAFALACALVVLGVQKSLYDQLCISIYVGKDEGEFALLPHAEIDTELNLKAMALCALGPVAFHEDPVTLLRSGDLRAIIAAGNLSDADVELSRKWKGSPEKQEHVLLAVKSMHNRLKHGGMLRMTQLFRKASSMKLDMRLSDFVPYNEAARAVRVAAEAGAA